MKRIFHIDLDAFFVAVERAHNPSLMGKPVVVGGEAESRGVVTCASYEARPYGLRAGMPLWKAHRLCPHAIFLTGRFHKYKEVSEGFIEILGSFSPFLEPLGLDEAFLDMTGFQSLYGPPADAAREIKTRVHKDLKVIASVGIASSKVAAKVASDYGKPDGLVEIPPGEDASFLSTLPVEQLPGVGAKTGVVLRTVLGVHTVGGLAQVSTPVLRRTFGVWGDLLHLWANGLDPSPVAPPGPPKSISRETTFIHDTGDRSFLLSTLRYLAERVGAELRQEKKRARGIVVKVRYADFETITRHCTIKVPAADDQTIFEAGAALLIKAIQERNVQLRLIGIGVADLVASTEQLAFFESPQKRAEQLSAVMDKIRSKYGFTSLQTGRTFRLGQQFSSDKRGYILKTACLSR